MKKRTLYHGTTKESKDKIIKEGIRLDVNQDLADFGPGFYLTPNKGLAKERGDGSLLAYNFDSSQLQGRKFQGVTQEWKEEIFSQRVDGIDKNNDVDYVVGPIADGSIYVLKIAFHEGKITKEQFLDAISKGRLPKIMQLAIKTQKAANKLTRINEEE